MTTKRQSERYNPITGIGIPAAPTRANTSAIFGGSPGGIERMFIPPSATTRPTETDSSCERRRSISRESLRRSFATVSEGKADSDECSSVSDASECGSEAGRRNSNASLGKTRKPLTRTTSSRLPTSAARPRVMKRAHSFTRENTSRPSRGATNDTHVTNSASDLTRQVKRPAASGTSKIPRKQSTGTQSTRAPLKRADVNSNSVANAPGKSGNENVVVKRTTVEPQARGIPVKAGGVQKRSADDGSRVQSEAKIGTGSGIPVKGSGSRIQQHPGSSKIPQVKRDRTQVISKKYETKDVDEGRKEMIDKENSEAESAVQTGEELLKREGTGDELRVTKSDTTKSKLPRRSSHPKVAKTKNQEIIGGELTTENNKQNVSNESCQSGGKGGNTEQHGVSKIPANKRMETKIADLSDVIQRTESSRGVTTSVGREEKPVAESGNEFSLSRENSRSKIPIISRKTRVCTDAVGRVPNEASEGVEATKRGDEKQGELRARNDRDSEEVSGAKMRLQAKGSGEQGVASEASCSMATVAMILSEIVIVNEEKTQECDVLTRDEGREKVVTADNTSQETATKDKELMMMTTKEYSVAEKTDELGGLKTRMDNTEEACPVPTNITVTPSIGVSTHADLSDRGHLVSDVDAKIVSLKRDETLLSENLQDKITPGEESRKISLKIAENSAIKNRGQTDEKIDDDGPGLRGNVRESCLEEPLKKDADHLASEMRDSRKEEFEKGEYLDEGGEYLDEGASGVEDMPAKMSDNCLECRMERHANEDGAEDSGFHSNVRRYPTFISPRKSLVLCKHHEKLKNESDGQQLEEPPQQNAQPLNEQRPGLHPQASSDVAGSKDSSKLDPQDVNQNREETIVKKMSSACDDELNSNVLQRTGEVSTLDYRQKKSSSRARKDDGKIRDVHPSRLDNEPAVEALNQRITAVGSACEKTMHNGKTPKNGDNPLLALSRDKKYVSGENLAPSKNAEAIKCALSLEWDDAGTELSPPNFSDDDEDESKKKGEELEDERRPSMKLMDTNEALDKLKMIQSLIMKEAESRSRKESVESAGKRDAEVPEEKQREARNDGGYRMNDRQLDRQSSDQENKEQGGFSQTSEAPTRDVSSPTIWDRISDNAISQDQTTELLNETLAKLKASPQLSGSALARRTISSRSLPGSRQASKEQLLSDTDRPVYVYTSSWMNASGKNSVTSSLSLCSANRSLPSSRQNLLAKHDPYGVALKRSESLSERIERENEKQNEHREKKEFRMSNFDEMLSEDGQQEQEVDKNDTMVSPVSETPETRQEPYKKSIKISQRKKKSKNTAQTMNNDAAVYGVSMEDLADSKTTCQCGKKGCVIS